MMMDFSNDLDKIDYRYYSKSIVLDRNATRRMSAVFEFENMSKRFGWINPYNWDHDRMIMVPIKNECGLTTWKFVRNPAWKPLEGEDERKELWTLMMEGFIKGYEKDLEI